MTQLQADPILAWHFLQPDGTVPRLNVKAEPGLVLKHEGTLKLCESGLHASVNPLHALSYAPSFIVSRVECSGDVVHGAHKLVCSTRKVLWVVDAKPQIVVFACWCAERALTARQKVGGKTDLRSWKAIEVTRAWLQGNATIDDVRAARNAAYAAYAAYAYAAAAAAANAAAANAAANAYAAAAAAANAAAYAAANAAYAAAAAAANAAAYAAANAAYAAANARSNEQVAQANHLEALLLALAPKEVST